MMSEVDCWMEWIENAMADSAFEENIIDDFDEFIGGWYYPYWIVIKALNLYAVENIVCLSTTYFEAQR